MNLHERLAALHLALPAPPEPVAAYVPSVRVGNLIYVSGQLPLVQGALLATGPVPSAVTVAQAQQAARQCALNALAIVDRDLAGRWEQLVRIVRLGVFVASDVTFTQQPQVANGASELMQQLFGEAGRHVRAAVGVNVLPLGAPVELEMVVAVE